MSSVTETKTARRVRSMVATCRAKDPRTCPYHGTVLRMEEALEAQNLDAYFVEKDKLEKLQKTITRMKYNLYQHQLRLTQLLTLTQTT